MLPAVVLAGLVVSAGLSATFRWPGVAVLGGTTLLWLVVNGPMDGVVLVAVADGRGSPGRTLPDWRVRHSPPVAWSGCVGPRLIDVHPAVTCRPPRWGTLRVVLFVVLTAWLLLSALTASGCAVVLRGGLHEDAMRGYLADRP